MDYAWLIASTSRSSTSWMCNPKLNRGGFPSMAGSTLLPRTSCQLMYLAEVRHSALEGLPPKQQGSMVALDKTATKGEVAHTPTLTWGWTPTIYGRMKVGTALPCQPPHPHLKETLSRHGHTSLLRMDQLRPL
eukprot:2544224-Prorocentrum_lima.AAC.1